MKKLYIIFLFIYLTLEKNLIEYEEKDKIAIIKFNNPTQLNKFDNKFLKELENLINSININKNIVLIITAEGNEYFSIGGRPEELKQMSISEREEYTFLMSKILKKIENINIPVIAVVNGLAFREGFELAVCCDFIICSENAIFGFNEKGQQDYYEFENPQRLLKYIDRGTAKKIILTKEFINKYEAFRIGLTNVYYLQDQIYEEGIKLAKIISKNGKNAILNSKKSINEGAKIINIPSKENNKITFLISIKYETGEDEKMYIIGNNSDFGNWKEKKYEMELTNGYIWKTKYSMEKNSQCIEYKFVCFSGYLEKWERGENRLLCPNNLEGLPKTLSGDYKLNLIWNYFEVIFNLHYPIVPPNTYMQINFKDAPNCLELSEKNEKKHIKMELKKDKTLPKNGIEISGLWTISFSATNSILNENYLDFEYKYSLFNIQTNTTLLERGRNRKLRVLLNEKEVDKDMDPNSACFLLKNSRIEVADANFVALFDFNKLGDKNIFMGTYLETEQDFKTISEQGINTILNVQTNGDLEYRLLDINVLNNYANKYGIKIQRYPIIDFNKEELYNKLKDAADLLNQLIQEGKTVYVHCTAGIGRSPSVVVIYLILYENYSIGDAIELCKKSRPKISVNFDVIDEITKNCKIASDL